MDYTKECWYCHGQTMQSKGDYYQCSECGTTWNEQPVNGIYTGIAPEAGADARILGKSKPVRKRRFPKVKIKSLPKSKMEDGI